MTRGGISREDLSFRIYSLITSVPPLPNNPDFFVVLQHALSTEHSSTGSVTYRCVVAMSQVVEAAVRLALSPDLLRASDGCVILPTAEELVTPAPTGSTSKHGRRV